MLATTWCLATGPTTVWARSMPSTTSSHSWPSCLPALTGLASGTVVNFATLVRCHFLYYGVDTALDCSAVLAAAGAFKLPPTVAISQGMQCSRIALYAVHSSLPSVELNVRIMSLCCCCCCCCRTAESDRIKYLPTIYPHDSIITMWQRGDEAPAAAAEADPADAHCTLDKVSAAGRTAGAAAGADSGLRQRRPQRA